MYRFQRTWSITHGVKKEKKRERDCIAFSVPGLLPTGSGTTETESKVLSTENLHPSKVPSFKPAVGQNIAVHASPTAMDPAFIISASSVLSTSFFPESSSVIKWRATGTVNWIFTCNLMTCVSP